MMKHFTVITLFKTSHSNIVTYTAQISIMDIFVIILFNGTFVIVMSRGIINEKTGSQFS